MKRLVSVLVCLLVVLACAGPVMAADLQGGYFFECDCALGSGVRFYIPADYSTGSLTYDSSGYLFNLTSSSVYLYSPDYPGYTIYAPRLSGFQYRSGSGGYDYTPLNVRNISDTNVEIFDEHPGMMFSTSQMLFILVVLVLVFIGLYIVIRR